MKQTILLRLAAGALVLTLYATLISCGHNEVQPEDKTKSLPNGLKTPMSTGRTNASGSSELTEPIPG